MSSVMERAQKRGGRAEELGTEDTLNLKVQKRASPRFHRELLERKNRRWNMVLPELSM